MTTTIPDERLREILNEEAMRRGYACLDLEEEMIALAAMRRVASDRLSPQAEDGGVTDEMVDAGYAEYVRAIGENTITDVRVLVRRALQAALSAAKKQGEG